VLDVPGLAEARQRALAPLLAHAAGAPRRAALQKPSRETRMELVPDGTLETKPGKERTLAFVPTPAPAVQAAQPVATPSSDRPMRVLFVDDSLSVRKVAEKTLSALGVSVALAVDGMDALNKLREGSFDMVFTDLEMPRMHGFELIRELRTLAAYRDLPIVVVTSRSGQKHQDQARELGANEYITKPFTAKSLDAALSLFRGHTRGSAT
jgi:CheY-like chemotaxis protein